MIRRGRRCGDEGSSLLLVIFLVFTLSLAIGAVADYARANLGGTISVRDARGMTYSLDAGVNGAINQIRYDFSQGRAAGFTGGQNLCNNFNAPSFDAQTITVACAGEQGVAGQADSGSVTAENNPNNRPPLAVMTDGPTTEPGITLDANGVFRIHGQVASTSTVDVSNATLKVEGDVNAVGPCSGNIISLGPPYAAPNYGTPQAVNCPPLGPAGTVPAMPGYDPATTIMPGSQDANVPTTCPPGWLIEFNPGLYTNAKALSQLTSGACTGKVLWFHPGVYVFNFTNNQGGHAWTLNDATSNIVGGTPYGWNPNSTVRPVIPRADQNNPTLHSCVTDQDAVPPGATASNLGVQFIFTGDSRIGIGNVAGNGNEGGNFEICAQPSSTGQEIALYGAPPIGGNATTFAATPSTAANVGTTNTFTPVAAGAVIDNTIASAAVPRMQTSATVNVSGFAPLDTSVLPPGASITNVTLKIAHSESSQIGSGAVSITGADGASFPNAVAVPPGDLSTTTHTSSYDVTRYLGSVARLQGGSPASVGYSVTNNKNNQDGTASLDGLELDVTWVSKSLLASAATSATSPAFATPSNSTAIDGTTSVTTLAGSGQTARIDLSGFNNMDETDLPAGAKIVSVVARIVHRESAAVSGFTVSGTTAQGASFTSTQQQTANLACQGASLCRDNVDLTSFFPTVASLRKIVTNPPPVGGETITGPNLSYTVTGQGTGSNKVTSNVELDGVRLDVTYLPNALGSESGCITKSPYAANDSTTCAVLQAVGNHAYVAIHGTIYAPAAVMDAKVMNGGTTLFGRGAFLRSLRLFFNPSVTYSDQNIYFTVNDPDPSTLTVHDRVVDFWACAGRVSTCSDANALLHGVAEYADTVTVGASVAVNAWSRRR